MKCRRGASLCAIRSRRQLTDMTSTYQPSSHFRLEESLAPILFPGPCTRGHFQKTGNQEGQMERKMGMW